MSCPNPLDASLLADYWLACLDPHAEEALEAHFFECEACAARLDEVARLAAALRRLANDGSLRVIVSDAFLDRAASAGLRVREYALSPGGSVQCTVTESDDLLIARLAADFAGARRVDLSLCDAQGVEQQRLADIPALPEPGSVLFQESISLAKALSSNTLIVRLVAVDDAGAQRLLGEYTFHHTRSLPPAS